MGSGSQGGVLARLGAALVVIVIAALWAWHWQGEPAGAAGLPELPPPLPPPTVPLLPELRSPSPPATPPSTFPTATPPTTGEPLSPHPPFEPDPAPVTVTLPQPSIPAPVRSATLSPVVHRSEPAPPPRPGPPRTVGLAATQGEPFSSHWPLAALAAAALGMATLGMFTVRRTGPAPVGVGGPSGTAQVRPPAGSEPLTAVLSQEAVPANQVPTPSLARAPEISAVVGAPRREVASSTDHDGLEALHARCEWADEMVAGAGIPVLDVPFVTVGGGLGSFAMVEVLRIVGVEKDDIAVVTVAQRPYETFRARAVASQMDDADLLRSDSGSRIDSPWGFPGYALEEAWRRRSLKPVGRVVVEPVLSEYFNPRCGQVYAGLEREAARIGWSDMLIMGRADVVRKRSGGGYFVLVSPRGDPSQPTALRCRYVHLAVGYHSLRVLPDVAAYRLQHGSNGRLVHAYEEHEHVYQALARRPGTVIVRGGGIAASRILERLIEDCERHGARTQIVHLIRRGESDPVNGGRNAPGQGIRHQPFNFPKGAFGGQLAAKVASVDEPARDALIRSMNGSTTPRRSRWQDQLARAGREGWYTVHLGQVEGLTPSPTGGIAATISPANGRPTRVVEADFLIDATGLSGEVRGHPVIDRLLPCGDGRLNGFGRLEVDHRFEVVGSRNGSGRVYASGAITLGAPVAPVDSFFGLNQAALAIADDLAGQGFCTRIGAARSVAAWWHWVRGEPI